MEKEELRFNEDCKYCRTFIAVLEDKCHENSALKDMWKKLRFLTAIKTRSKVQNKFKTKMIDLMNKLEQEEDVTF